MGIIAIISYIIHLLLRAMSLLIVVRAILSFFPVPYQLQEIITAVTEPVLFPIRQILYKLGAGNSGLDFSPLVAVLLLSFIGRIL